ncbi:Lipase [Lachnellula suecica]|uniref:Lipase n=1 Tax=Lachnellula suecica TaxID=602035 RepID=A0A8T9CGV1_9HELO|nr:Lipase [Lachnellula suecica]
MDGFTSANMWLTLVFTIASIHLTNALPTADLTHPIAHIRNGSYYGTHNTHFNQDFFLGVPFAQPPVKDLRLRPPMSLNNTWTGLKNATEYGYACIGYGEDTEIGGGDYVSEDCLSLNIVRPAGYEHEELPVAVWIYGGGWFEGTALDPRYNSTFIVEQSVLINKPIIAVSINYRVSGWGWLYSKEIVEAGVANLGLRDQRLALHWLQENIGAFGGDKKKVTIWGENAGAGSVGRQLLAYNGRDDGLFSGAISESGPTAGFGLIDPIPEISEVLYQNLTEALGCSDSADKLDCLRKVPTDAFNNYLNSSGKTEDYYHIYYGPQIDGDIVFRNSISQIEDGDFVKVPYIMGENTDEGTGFIPFGINTDSDFTNYFAGWGLDNTTLSEFARLYPNNAPNEVPATHPASFDETIGLQFKRAATLMTDALFTAPKRLASEAWVKNTNASLYSYRFNTIPNGVPDYFAVTHYVEVAFVFHNVKGQGFPGLEPPYFGEDPFKNEPASYVELADEMSRRWVSFVHDGTPDYEGCTGPKWPKYTLDSPKNIVFDANVTTSVEPDIYRKETVDYFIGKFKAAMSFTL